MLTLIAIALIAMAGSTHQEAVYVLERPGIAFGWLPEEMLPPQEGTLTEEAGVVTADRGVTEMEYQIHYRRETSGVILRKDEWLVERFNNLIAPDLLPSIRAGEVRWVEGSRETGLGDTASVGLIPVMNFNIIGAGGELLARGRTCAIFTEGYSTLFYMMVPASGDLGIEPVFERIISNVYRT